MAQLIVHFSVFKKALTCGWCSPNTERLSFREQRWMSQYNMALIGFAVEKLLFLLLPEPLRNMWAAIMLFPSRDWRKRKDHLWQCLKGSCKWFFVFWFYNEVYGFLSFCSLFPSLSYVSIEITFWLCSRCFSPVIAFHFFKRQNLGEAHPGICGLGGAVIMPCAVDQAFFLMGCEWHLWPR